MTENEQHTLVVLRAKQLVLREREQSQQKDVADFESTYLPVKNRYYELVHQWENTLSELADVNLLVRQLESKP